jgi:hypothetical protein
MKRVLAIAALAALPGLTLAGRVFVLADDQGQRQNYAAFRESPWPEAAAEHEQFRQIADALKRDRSLGVMMIAPDRAAMQRAERALGTHLRYKLRRLAIRERVGPLKPIVLFGQRER